MKKTSTESYLDYRGSLIWLTDERRAHVLAHPEMLELFPRIGRTLRNPELVIQSRSVPQVYLYYAFEADTQAGSKWLCIVVKLATLNPFILTAYLTDKPKTGVVIWPNR